jgi:hypothetical protein
MTMPKRRLHADTRRPRREFLRVADVTTDIVRCKGVHQFVQESLLVQGDVETRHDYNSAGRLSGSGWHRTEPAVALRRGT